MKPKYILQRRIRYTYGGDPIQKMWDRYRKISGDNLGRKIKSTGFIYLPGSKFLEAEGNLSMRSCLQDAVIYSAPRIVKYIKKFNCIDSVLLEE